jgi:hypothetical protein
MKPQWIIILCLGVAATACTTNLEAAACDQIAATADCTVSDPERARDACIEGYEQLSSEFEAIGCGPEFDAYLECIARTEYRCSGDNFPSCHAESDAWFECCSADGMTCPSS